MYVQLLLITLMCQLVWSVNVSHRNVSEICDRIRCPDDQVCRVFRHCERVKCQPEFTCIPCVPEGADEECNTRGYLYSVLFGDPTRTWSLIPLNCSNGAVTCPHGSTCVYHPVFVDEGVCCFGGPSATPVTNDQKKCRVCVPECQPGYRCEKVVDECDKEYSQCNPLPKQGKCPLPTAPIFLHGRNLQKCEMDQDCPGYKKCCQNSDGDSFCTRPSR